jgi:HK97 family phage prohead protease
VKQIVATSQFKSLVAVIETLLERGLVLDTNRLQMIHKSIGGEQLEHKTVKTTTRTETDLGGFTAIAAAYTLDRDKERIVPGAFEKSLAAWRKRNRAIPLHWSHLGDPQYIIGSVDPHTAREIKEGLFVKGRVDLDHGEIAREAWQLVKSGTVGLSFGSSEPKARNARTAPATSSRSTCSKCRSPLRRLTPPPGFCRSSRPTRRLARPNRSSSRSTPSCSGFRTETRTQMLALLGAPLPPADALEREHKRDLAQLRRKCDRIQLERPSDSTPT